jgi:hypothetical protein
MKKIIGIFFVVFFALFVNSFAQWAALPFPGEHKFTSIQFINEQTGFVSATDGYSSINCISHIWKTTNSGQKWESVLADSIIIYAINYLGSTMCAVGVNSVDYTGVTYVSHNSGESWSKANLTNNVGFSDVVVNNQGIYVGCYDLGLYYSSDGGNTWNLNFFANSAIFSLIQNSSLYAISENNLFMQKNGVWEDKGSYGIWGEERSTSINPLNGEIYIGGYTYSYYERAVVSHTTNNGVNWKIDTLQKEVGMGTVRTTAFNNRGEVYAGGTVWIDYVSYSCIWKKSGNNWSEDRNFNDLGILHIVSVGDVFYAIGVLKIYRIDVATGINQNIQPKMFELKQNYPNPFNPVTKITYMLPKNSMVTLKVYDITGREISSLVNQKQSAGNYETSFNAGNLSSGVYFYKLTAGEFTSIKKMMLIK